MFDPINLPIRLPIGAPFPVDVVDAEPSLSQYRITIQVPYDTWDTVDVFEAFNLKTDVRGPGQISGKGDVRLELRLADDLVPELIQRIAQLGPRDGVLELANSGDDAPELVTESWFALHVTQAVELPEELRQPGNQVRSGFSTTWADADTVELAAPQTPVVPQHRPDPASEPWPELLAVVHGYLDANGISFVRHQGADMVSSEVEGINGTWSMWIHSRESERQVLVYSVFPQPIDEAHRGQVAELIGRLNVRMLTGNFEIDPDDGGFRCRTSIIVNGATLNNDLLDGVIPSNSMAMDHGVAALQLLLGGATIDEAIAAAPKPSS